jgi:hypothetical protein
MSDNRYFVTLAGDCMGGGLVDGMRVIVDPTQQIKPLQGTGGNLPEARTDPAKRPPTVRSRISNGKDLFLEGVCKRVPAEL